MERSRLPRGAAKATDQDPEFVDYYVRTRVRLSPGVLSEDALVGLVVRKHGDDFDHSLAEIVGVDDEGKMSIRLMKWNPATGKLEERIDMDHAVIDGQVVEDYMFANADPTAQHEQTCAVVPVLDELLADTETVTPAVTPMAAAVEGGGGGGTTATVVHKRERAADGAGGAGAEESRSHKMLCHLRRLVGNDPYTQRNGYEVPAETRQHVFSYYPHPQYPYRQQRWVLLKRTNRWVLLLDFPHMPSMADLIYDDDARFARKNFSPEEMRQIQGGRWGEALLSDEPTYTNFMRFTGTCHPTPTHVVTPHEQVTVLTQLVQNGSQAAFELFENRIVNGAFVSCGREQHVPVFLAALAQGAWDAGLNFVQVVLTATPRKTLWHAPEFRIEGLTIGQIMTEFEQRARTGGPDGPYARFARLGERWREFKKRGEFK
jgi:hypothetical protein